jgi:hypothetical protein
LGECPLLGSIWELFKHSAQPHRIDEVIGAALKSMPIPVTIEARHNQGYNCASVAPIICGPWSTGKRVFSPCGGPGRFSSDIRDDSAIPPTNFNRSTSRTWRMAVLSAGIRSLLRKAEGADLSRPAEASDPRARSSRNGGRHHLGTVGEIISESAGGIIPE